VTGQLGVAAQSCYFALGSVLPWARAGVGAVATQSMVDPGYGPRCLDRLSDGTPVEAALEQVRAQDPDAAVRQVGLVDASGAVASFTGERCLDHVGHVSGDGFSAQANMMRGPGVCEAMAAAFEGSTGTLAERMVAALVAAEGAGGDARGVMSAALIVVEGIRQPEFWQGVLVDVRVDHDSDPLGQLARLVRVADAYRRCDVAEEALVAGDTAAALAGAEAGLALLPGEGNLLLSYIGALIGVGRIHEARQQVQVLMAIDPGWEIVVRAVTERGLVPLPDGLSVEMLLDPQGRA
jgi:uncharacterized Ntn-hydrolase superfamily protein